jgi:hypothetical protein
MRSVNRRVAGFLMADGTIQFRFKRLMPDRSVFVSRIQLTPEATRAMAEIMIKLSSPNAGDMRNSSSSYRIITLFALSLSSFQRCPLVLAA